MARQSRERFGMDLNCYSKIKGFVYKNLHLNLHNRHFDDAVQFVATEYFLGKVSFKLNFWRYLNENGLTKNGKRTAKTIEMATFVGLQNDEKETETENAWMLNAKSIEIFNDNEQEKTCEDIIIELLEPLNLTKGAFKWATKTYLSRLRSKNLTMLTRRLK